MWTRLIVHPIARSFLLISTVWYTLIPFPDFAFPLSYPHVLFQLTLLTHQPLCSPLQVSFSLFRISSLGTSLVIQSLKICLAMQGTRIQLLVEELRSHMPCWATKPMCHNYWAHAICSLSATVKDPTCCNQDPPRPDKYIEVLGYPKTAQFLLWWFRIHS